MSSIVGWTFIQVCGRYLKGKGTREEGGPPFMCARALQCDDFNRGHLRTFIPPIRNRSFNKGLSVRTPFFRLIIFDLK